MPTVKVFRDDDVNRYTDLNTFIAINNLLKKYGKIHTCAVEMSDLWESKGIWSLLQTEPNVEVGLHGWEHKDYSVMAKENIIKEFSDSINYWNNHSIEGFGKVKPITTYYPTWNRISQQLIDACKVLGLRLDSRVGGEVFNFHWWEFIGGQGLERLEALLK